jgi:L-threonylcarbamoyladenylate synthase
MSHDDLTEAINALKDNKLVVTPTDTIYGILARASSESAVEEVYKVRKRQSNKPCIILVSDVLQLKAFGVKEDKLMQASTYWPGPVSLILPVESVDNYLTRGKASLAFRLPDYKFLQKIIEQTGPLIAPSANIAGEPPVETIDEAKQIFGDLINLYVDGGIIRGEASRLLSLEHEQPRRLR